MKLKTAVRLVEESVDNKNYVGANDLLRKYRLKFGNRKFSYWLRVAVKNGLWEMGC